MAKQVQEPTKEQQERAKEVQVKKDKANKRMIELSQNIFKAIQTTCDGFEEPLTYTEMNEVLIRIQHSYNGKALANQFTSKK